MNVSRSELLRYQSDLCIYLPMTTQFTDDDLWKNPNLIAIDADVYNIEPFAPLHPGGSSALLASGGKDLTGLFYSMHKQDQHERYQAILSKYKVGMYVSNSKKYEYESDFINELFQEVVKELPSHKWFAPKQFWIRTVLICIFTIVFEIGWIFTGMWEFALLTGLMHAQIGLAVQHDASHGALSKDSRINTLFAYGADWIGNTRWLWFEQHIIGHHPNTNDLVKDPDVTSADPFLLFHTFDSKFRKFLHQFQHILLYPVLSLYGPSVVYNLSQLITLNHNNELPVENNLFLKKQQIPSVLLRLFYYFRMTILPYYLNENVSLILCLFGVNFVTGICLTFVFVLSHNFVGSCRFPEKLHTDWYRMQVETSCTYGGFISGLLTGGLNFQIEHHLFPRMNSWHYPTISPIVRRVCEKHQVNYTYFPNIVENIKSTISFMKMNGLSNIKIE